MRAARLLRRRRRILRYVGHDGATTSSRRDARLLGRGAFGEVWRAEVGRDAVAVKKTDPAHGAREVAALRRCPPHPHLVKLVDSFRKKSKLMVVLGLVGHGFTVAHFLHVPDLDRRSVVAQVCGALAHLHAHAVIHRDIKSSNILIKRLRDPVHVVVSDLGVACVGSYNAACIRGDVHWASSEVAFRGHYLPAADMYAVGCVVAELLLRAPEVSRMCGASLLPWHMQAGFAATLAALCDSPRDDDYLTPLMVDLLADTPSLRPAAAAVVSRLRREESAARRIQRAARRRPRRPVNVAVNEKTGAPHCDF